MIHTHHVSYSAHLTTVKIKLIYGISVLSQLYCASILIFLQLIPGLIRPLRLDCHLLVIRLQAQVARI